MTEDPDLTPADFELSVGVVFMSYPLFCEFRGEVPDPALVGQVVCLHDGVAELVDV